MIKISVIIPIYNMEQYLEECLQSILNQTLKEIEIICINDGSSDGSLNILNKYASKCSNMIIVNQENLGVSKARNNGINIASGEFVAFMDPDDYYPEMDILEHMYHCAKTNNVYICGGSLSSLINDKIKTKYFGWRKKYVFDNDKKMSYQDYQFHYGFTRFIYNLQFLKNNNIYFPRLKSYEDPPFFVRAMLCANEFYSLKKITYCYREGYKDVLLTSDRLIDAIYGVIDILKISVDKKLDALHINVVKSIREDNIAISIYENILKRNVKIENLVYKINKLIDIRKLENNEKYLLLKPSCILSYREEIKKDFLDNITRYDGVVIYGAGKVGRAVAKYIKSVGGINIMYFAVSEKNEVKTVVDEIEVVNICEIKKYAREILILVATSENFHEEIQANLKRLGFENFILIDTHEFKILDIEI